MIARTRIGWDCFREYSELLSSKMLQLMVKWKKKELCEQEILYGNGV